VIRILLTVVVLTMSNPAHSAYPPPTIDELTQTKPATELKFERALDDGRSFTSYLVSYRNRGLRLHALVAVPRSTPPDAGFPVLVANHGTHPDPPRYGFTAQGVDSRPGDYYRSVPELYASRGFMVVMPDYRGHNVSEGGEYAHGFLASSYYAEDVLALLGALDSLEHADTSNVFMWGHSLGGEVTLKAMLATDRVRGASIWSTVGGSIWDQAYFYSAREGADAAHDGSAVPKDAFVQLKRELDAFGSAYDWRQSDPLLYIDRLSVPVALHHARLDAGADYDWSRRLAAQLYALGKTYEFHTYPVSEHFFEGANRETAADRDARFFRSLLVPSR
jgi:dipeptidyl aminopeptidase/acylaminoacyl peptidase